jgi:hypothetical protein
MKRLWRYLSLKNFFGLSDEYQESIYEQIFYLKYYGGISIIESYNLPIQLRIWFLQKIKEKLEEEAKAYKK